MKEISIKEILDYLDTENITHEYFGELELYICGYSSLGEYKTGTITWIKNLEKMKDITDYTGSLSLVVMDDETYAHMDNKPSAIVCSNPKNVFYTILDHFYGDKKGDGIRGKNIVVDESAQIDETVCIGHGCIIGENVIIRKGTRLYNNVIIEANTTIGENCVIKSGVIIGEEGYGYSERNGVFYHAPHYGGVEIGNDVEIGANTVIDRGSI